MSYANVVKYILLPHKITVHPIKWKGSIGSCIDLVDIDTWCREHVGKEDKAWTRNELTFSGKVVYHFDKEEDATMFALKWK